MTEVAVDDLIGAQVRVRGVRVGEVEDVVADPRHGRVLGLVARGPGGQLFLPWPAAVVDGSGVHASSALALFSGAEIAYYLEHGVRLRAADGAGELVVAGSGEIVAGGRGDV